MWLAIVAVCATPWVARGQQPQAPARDTGAARDSTPVVLVPVQVRGSIAPSAGPAVGSGVPARVSIVTSEQVDDWSPRVLPDILAIQPGVSVYDDLGSPWKLNLSTRGFTAGPTVGLPPGVTVFLDGVRQNEPAAQEVNFDLLPLDDVARIEMLAGSASLLGPNSLGGGINLVTARGTGPLAGAVELSGGSFGGSSMQARLGGGTATGSDYFAAGGVERERGWREGTGARSYNALVNVGREAGGRGLVLQGHAARSRAETAGSLPESIFALAPRTNFTAGDFEDVEAQQLAVSGHASVGAGRGALSAHVRRSSAERFNVNQQPDPDVRSRTASVTGGATADWRAVFPTGSGSLALRLGTDASVNRVRARIYAEPAGGAGELTTDVRSPSMDIAGYALADYRLRRVTFSGGGRYDFVRVPFYNQIRTSDRTVNDYRHFSPRIAASVEAGHGAGLYASAGRSFRAPAILELGCADPEAACPLPFALGDDPPLAPVRATTYEVGGHWLPRWSRGALVATLSAYRTDVRDEIFFVASEAALYSGYFTNLPRTRREGLESGVRGTAAGGRLWWYANHAWTRATFQSDAELFSVRGDDDFAGSPLAGDNDVEPGDRLPLVPEHQAKAGGTLGVGAGVSVGLDARYTGRQWLRGDEANVTAPLSGYTVANARIAYARGAWRVAARVTNLLDARAATFGTFNENREYGALERFLTPLHARALTLTVRRAVGTPAQRID